MERPTLDYRQPTTENSSRWAGAIVTLPVIGGMFLVGSVIILSGSSDNKGALVAGIAAIAGMMACGAGFIISVVALMSSRAQMKRALLGIILAIGVALAAIGLVFIAGPYG